MARQGVIIIIIIIIIIIGGGGGGGGWTPVCETCLQFVEVYWLHFISVAQNTQEIMYKFN